MRAGRLRHSIIIQHYTTTYDEYNAPIQTWATFATVRAGIEPLKGEERFLAAQRQASTTHRVVTRYVPGVTAAMRVKFGDRYFAIKEILNPQERNRELHLMCEEGLQDE